MARRVLINGQSSVVSSSETDEDAQLNSLATADEDKESEVASPEESGARWLEARDGTQPDSEPDPHSDAEYMSARSQSCERQEKQDQFGATTVVEEAAGATSSAVNDPHGDAKSEEYLEGLAHIGQDCAPR